MVEATVYFHTQLATNDNNVSKALIGRPPIGSTRHIVEITPIKILRVSHQFTVITAPYSKTPKEAAGRFASFRLPPEAHSPYVVLLRC